MDLADPHRLRPHRALPQLLDENVDVRIITTFLGVGILSLYRATADGPGPPLQPRRAARRGRPNPDRHSSRPRSTTRRRRAFTTTSRGRCSARTASVPSCQAVPENAADLSDDELATGTGLLGHGRFAVAAQGRHRSVRTRTRRHPRDRADMILSSHLPAAAGTMMERLLASLEAVPSAPPFVAPDQAALEQMLTEMTAGAAR